MLAQTLEGKRAPPRAVASRMLGSHTDAADAVKDAGPRLIRSHADEIGNAG